MIKLPKLKSDVKREIPKLVYERLIKCLEKEPPAKFKGYDFQNFILILDLVLRLGYENPKAKRTKDGKIRIPCKIFKQYITYGYSLYINYLNKHHILDCDYLKCEGKAYAYGIPDNLQSDLIEIYLNKDSIIAQRVIYFHKKRTKQGISHKKKNYEEEEKNKLLREQFSKIEKVDLEGGITFLKKELEENKIDWNQYHSGVLSLKALSEDLIFFKISGKNGRLNTNLTNLPSKLRKYVFKNADMIHIDCKNSQPYMINILSELLIQNTLSYTETSTELKSENSSQPHTFPLLDDAIAPVATKVLSVKQINYLNKFPLNDKVIKEFNKFRDATTIDNFYLSMVKEFEITTGQKVSRDDMKKVMFMVLFSPNYMFHKEKAIFKSLYPNIYRIIYNLKRDKHNKFALLLQNIESTIFIKHICKNLINAGIVPFTIHDSVIVPAKYKEKTIEIMQKTCESFTTVAPEFVASELK